MGNRLGSKKNQRETHIWVGFKENEWETFGFKDKPKGNTQFGLGSRKNERETHLCDISNEPIRCVSRARASPWVTTSWP